MNEGTTPIEASLKWTIGKRRQETFDFIGGDVIKKQIQEGIKRRRVGILSDGAPARAGALITLPDGTKVCVTRTAVSSAMPQSCIRFSGSERNHLMRRHQCALLSFHCT